jgi:hypothetical protein
VQRSGTGNCKGSLIQSFDIARATGKVPELEILPGRVGYTQGSIALPEQWSWFMPGTKSFTVAQVGDTAFQAIYAPTAEEKTNFDWAGVATTVSLPVSLSLVPDTAWIQISDIANEAAVFSVRAGAWEHLNWSSLAADFAPNFDLAITPNEDASTYTVAIQGKSGTIYEKVSATAQVGADGKLLTGVDDHPAPLGHPSGGGEYFDVRGNRIVGTPKTPVIYILRQGSQTRKIVVR